jgi:hypothetical protein
MSYTGTEFKTLIGTQLNRADLTTLIPTFCDLAIKQLEEHCLWFQLASITVSTTAATKYVALPSGFLKVVLNGFRDTSGTPLIKTDWATLDYWQTYSAGTGEPDYYAIADKFYFYSIPDATYALPLQYYKSLGFPADGSSNSWTDDVWDMTMWETLKQAWLYLDNTKNQVKCEQEMTKCLNRYKSRSGKLTGKGSVTYRDF